MRCQSSSWFLVPSGLVGLALMAPPAAVAQETVALRCGSLIDGRSDTPVANATVIVKDGKVTAAGPNVSIPAGAREVDLRKLTCLPGLIDLHVHLSAQASSFGNSSAEKSMMILANAQRMLQHGFTTVRDLGEDDAYYAPIAVRDAIARGDFDGPRMFVAPHMMSSTGGHGDHGEMAADLALQVPNRVFAAGADGVRQAIREELKGGADWIKIAVTGGVMSSGDDPNVTTMSPAEIDAAVAETHAHHKKITVHAIGTDGIKAAVKAGVDGIEHGILIDDETIDLMKQKGTWLVPTIYVLNHVIDEGAKYGYRADMIEKGRALRVERDRRIKRAIAGGVKVAFGSDNIFPVVESAKEFAELVRLGMTPMQAIKAATVSAAQVLDLGSELGTVEAGRTADIVAVAGNPLDDVNRLLQMAFVMHRGKVVKPVAAESNLTP